MEKVRRILAPANPMGHNCCACYLVVLNTPVTRWQISYRHESPVPRGLMFHLLEVVEDTMHVPWLVGFGSGIFWVSLACIQPRFLGIYEFGTESSKSRTNHINRDGGLRPRLGKVGISAGILLTRSGRDKIQRGSRPIAVILDDCR